MNEKPIIYIVVPCYNESEVLPVSLPVFRDKISQLIEKDIVDKKSKILLVDDGSTDDTWKVMCKYHSEDDVFSAMSLSKNRGHQNALLAGLMYAKDMSDVTISIDCDLQDDVDAMDEMMEKYSEGCHIVYGIRSSRQSDSFFKRNTALAFYKFMSYMGVESIYNHADYRLMDKTSLEALSKYNETYLYLRGIVPLVGYRSDKVYYKRGKRAAGISKYPLKKMIDFAVDGITSFTFKPLKLITRMSYVLIIIGVLLFIMSAFGMVGVVVASVWLIGGIQLWAIGLVGSYVGRIFGEVKNRPRYNIREILDDSQSK